VQHHPVLTRSPRARALSRAGLLAIVAISLVVLGSIHAGQRAGLKAFAAQTAPAAGPSIPRAVVDVMTRELRMASYGVERGIVEATPTRIRFRQDLDRDGTIARSGGEDVAYDLVGETIRRTDGDGAPAVLADGIATNGLTFRYFDGGTPPAELLPAGTPPALGASQRERVAKIRIDVLAHVPSPDPRVSTPIATLAESEVAIRTPSPAN
jgi:hypothetical protein